MKRSLETPALAHVGQPARFLSAAIQGLGVWVLEVGIVQRDERRECAESATIDVLGVARSGRQGQAPRSGLCDRPPRRLASSPAAAAGPGGAAPGRTGLPRRADEPPRRFSPSPTGRDPLLGAGHHRLTRPGAVGGPRQAHDTATPRGRWPAPSLGGPRHVEAEGASCSDGGASVRDHQGPEAMTSACPTSARPTPRPRAGPFRRRRMIGLVRGV